MWLARYKFLNHTTNKLTLWLYQPRKHSFEWPVLYCKYQYFVMRWYSRTMYWWPVDSPHKGQRRGALIFSLIFPWTNGCANNRDAGDLRSYRAHYNVAVMNQVDIWRSAWYPKLRSMLYCKCSQNIRSPAVRNMYSVKEAFSITRVKKSNHISVFWTKGFFDVRAQATCIFWFQRRWDNIDFENRWQNVHQIILIRPISVLFHYIPYIQAHAILVYMHLSRR